MKTKAKIFIALLIAATALSAVFLSGAAPSAAAYINVRVESSVKGDLLVWDPVPNAEHYTVKVNGQVLNTDAPLTQIPLQGLVDSAGRYVLTVAAYDSKDNIIARGSTDYTWRLQLDTPYGFEKNGAVIEWRSIKNADSYSIELNGINLGEVFEPRFDTSEYAVVPGRFVIRVTALSDSEYYSDSVAGEFSFDIADVPAPPADIRLSVIGGRYIASWTFTDGVSYMFYVNGGEPVASENNYTDVTSYITADGTITVAAACVDENGESAFTTKTFTVPCYES